MAEEKVVNGVNVDKLFGTIDAVKEAPVIAKFKFRAKNKWINGGVNRTTIKDTSLLKRRATMCTQLISLPLMFSLLLAIPLSSVHGATMPPLNMILSRGFLWLL